MSFSKGVCWAVSVGVLASPAARLACAAQPPAARPASTPPTDAASLTLSGQVELARLVDLCAKRLGVNIEYDAAALKGMTVTLRLDAPVSDGELWALTNRLLVARNLVTVRPAGGRTMSVVKLADAPGLAELEQIPSLAAVTNPAGLAGAGPREAAPGVNPAVAPIISPGFRSVLVTLENIGAKEAGDAIRPVLNRGGGGGGGGGNGTPAPAGDRADPQRIAIADLSSRVEDALTLLKRIDVPGGGVQVVEVPVKNLAAAQLAANATAVIVSRDKVSGEKRPVEIMPGPDGKAVLLVSPARDVPTWRALLEQLDKREPVETVTYTPRGFGAKDVADLIDQTVRGPLSVGVVTSGGAGGGGGTDERWRVVTDALTGSLIITATASQHARIADLLARLDAIPAEQRRPIRSFVVRNRPVGELLDVLHRMVEAGVLDAGDAGGDKATTAASTTTSPAGAPTQSPFSADVPRPPGSPPTSVNVLSGETAPNAPLLPKPGKSPQTPRPGVTPATLTLTSDEATSTIIAIGDSHVLDQLASLVRTLDVRQPQVMLEVTLVSLSDSDTLSLGAELQKIVIRGGTSINLASLFGLSSAATSPGGATRTVPDTNGANLVVLNPGDFSIIVKALETLNHGRTSSMPRMLVSNNQAAVFNATLQQPYATALTTNTATSQSFGGSSDAGTQLSVKPQIGQGDHLLLTYTISISAFTGDAQANLPPPRQVNSVQSVADIPDGSVIVVGGIDLASDTRGTTQIPFLGDIPIIGEAFKSRNNSTSRSRFFAFIKASIMRGEGFENLRYVSNQDSAAAGLPPQWPTLEPLVIR